MAVLTLILCLMFNLDRHLLANSLMGLYVQYLSVSTGGIFVIFAVALNKNLGDELYFL